MQYMLNFFTLRLLADAGGPFKNLLSSSRPPGLGQVLRTHF